MKTNWTHSGFAITTAIVGVAALIWFGVAKAAELVALIGKGLGIW